MFLHCKPGHIYNSKIRSACFSGMKLKSRRVIFTTAVGNRNFAVAKKYVCLRFDIAERKIFRKKSGHGSPKVVNWMQAFRPSDVSSDVVEL